MPRLPIDYSNTIMYRIICNDLNIKECYVGHTTDFIRRKNQHKCSCNNEKLKQYNFNIYTFIRNNGGWTNWNMIEIEKYTCYDTNEAKKRERYWIEFYNSSLNSCIPLRTDKEYRENNKDKIKEWFENNIDKIKEYQKEYRENNNDKIKEHNKEYYENNIDKFKEHNKEYYENNKEKIKEYQKEYNENNKDKIKEYKKEYCKDYYENNKEKYKMIIKCDCGCEIIKNQLKRHQKSKKHQQLMEQHS